MSFRPHHRHPRVARLNFSTPRGRVAVIGLGALLMGTFSPINPLPAVASAPQLITVTGGTITDYQGYRYHAFTHTGGLAGVTPGPDSSTTHELVVEGSAITVDYLIVAGGGGGGRNRGAGGGAGGLLQGSATLATANHEIQVGGGGKGGTQWTSSSEASSGCRGANSSFNGLTAVGGGGGAAFPSGTGPTYRDCENGFADDSIKTGGLGGSGGGGSYENGSGGSGTAGQGNSGGGGSAGNAGGGGGAGAPGKQPASATGETPAISGDGGNGLTSPTLAAMGVATTTGEDSGGEKYFAGGGGGFRDGLGGLGGGGDHGKPGDPSTGGGGGACNVTGCAGGSPGGSGIVIVRYAVPQFTAITEPAALTDGLSQTIDFGTGMSTIGLTGADSVEVVDDSLLPPGITLGAFANNEVSFTGSATAVGIYTFTLRAFKDDPASGPTVVTDRQVTVTVSAVLPGIPTGLDVADDNGDTVISLTTVDPGSNNVSFEATVDGGNTWTTLVAQGADWLFPDFDRSTQQAVQVRARNEAGTSSPTSAVVFPQFMLNNGLFRVGGGGHDNTAFTRVASIGTNGQIIQPFYYDSRQSKWVKMTYLSEPFDFAVGFGTGNEPSENDPYNATKNWTGATVYGTFQDSDPFDSPVAGSQSVTVEDFTCTFTDLVCMGTGTVIASADFVLGGRTVTVVNRYTLNPNSRFLEVETTVSNPDGSPLPNVNVWVGTRDDWVGTASDADRPKKFRGTIDSDGEFEMLSSSSDRSSALVLESADGAGLFFSTSPGVNATVAPCCESLEAYRTATNATPRSHTARGFENAVVLNPAQSAVSTPLPASAFKPADPNAEFFQNQRTDLRDAGYALLLPLGNIPASESNSATWFLGGTAFADRADLFTAVKEAAPPAQALTFPALGNQRLAAGTVTATATTTLVAPNSPPGLAPIFASTTQSVCTVTSSGQITLLERGQCEIVASQPGGTLNGVDVSAADSAGRTFLVRDPSLASLTVSEGQLQPAFSPGRTAYTVSVANSVDSVTFTPAARFAGTTIDVAGTPTTSAQESASIPLTVGSNTVSLIMTDDDVTETIVVTITRAALPSPAGNRQSTTRPPAALAPTLPGGLLIPRPPTTAPVLTPNPTQAPQPAQGPVITGGQPPRPSSQPTATVGGVPQPVTKAPIGTTGVRVLTGTVDVGVRVNSPQQGTVQTSPEGTPELSVVKGQPTVISGTGVAPGSTVQAFLPLNGTNAIELGRIQADATGTFSGQAVLNTPITRAPLPVGRQVLQILGVDENGNQTVVNMTINIAQPPPQPEINRENREVPTLGVGQSLATEAGVPVAVTVTPVPENNQTLIEGNGWTMGISVAGEGAEVEETADGDVVLKLVRDETAAVSGSGFMPLTRADVWLFSEPTLLGTVDIDENGEFNGTVNVDGNVVTVGEHTLQLQGIGEDGYVRAANLGVVVGDNPELSPAPTATASLTWLLWLLAGVAGAAIIGVTLWLRQRRLLAP